MFEVMEDHEKFGLIYNCIDSKECVNIDDRLVCVYYLYTFNEEVYALGHKQDEPRIVFNERLLDINEASNSMLPFNPLATKVLKDELRHLYIDPVKTLEGKGFKMENEIQIIGDV